MKKALSLILAIAFCLSRAACAAPAAKEEVDHSKITADPGTKTVKIYAEVNGKYFTNVTRHGVVFKDGSNGEKSVLRGLCSEKDFYAAMLSIGAVPGDNLDPADALGKTIEGDKLDITVSWDGSNGEIPFEDCIKTSNGAYRFDPRFGGNIKAAYAKNTGCIFCLDSCPVGITSNAEYPLGVIEATKTEEFFGNSEVLPKDGTLVTVTFTLLA